MLKITLAGINMAINSAPWTLSAYFSDFIADFAAADVQCDVSFTSDITPDIEACHRIFATDTQTVYIKDRLIYIMYHDKLLPSYLTASDDWASIRIYISGELDKPEQIYTVNRVRFGLSQLLKTVFVHSLALREGVLIHSATIVWNGKGVLFTAPSGTGKSTQAHLWRDKYGIGILDGDATACRLTEAGPIVSGLPWSGSSGEYMNADCPLGAVIFLEQSDSNAIRKLETAEAAVLLYARCFQFSWDEHALDRILHSITEIVSKTDCLLLKCRPDLEAVELVKQCLE